MKTKLRTTTSPKLPIQITFITHSQNTKENAITLNNRQHSNYFWLKWIQTLTLNAHCFAQHLPPNHKRIQHSKATSLCRTTRMHSIQWHTLKAHMNQHLGHYKVKFCLKHYSKFIFLRFISLKRQTNHNISWWHTCSISHQSLFKV